MKGFGVALVFSLINGSVAGNKMNNHSFNYNQSGMYLQDNSAGPQKQTDRRTEEPLTKAPKLISKPNNFSKGKTRIYSVLTCVVLILID